MESTTRTAKVKEEKKGDLSCPAVCCRQTETETGTERAGEKPDLVRPQITPQRRVNSNAYWKDWSW